MNSDQVITLGFALFCVGIAVYLAWEEMKIIKAQKRLSKAQKRYAEMLPRGPSTRTHKSKLHVVQGGRE